MTALRTVPRVTIVMTARERHSLTEAALDSIVAETPEPHRLVYLDAQSPRWLADVLAERAAEWNLDIVRFDEPLWPQEARARFMPSVDTEYTVFVDNDVEVEAGWLDALVRCADETGAGIVGPLYLWGDGVHAAKIHMAGGALIDTPAEGGRVLDESHRLFNADPRMVRSELVRQPCDFVEFHCMLVRTSLAREAGFFDAAIRCVHEHIDVALQCTRRGLPVMLEPASRVRYLAFVDYMLDDLPFFRERWSIAEGEASIAAFARKWGVVNDDRSFGGVRSFLASHLTHADPLLAEVLGVERRTPMASSQIARERSPLLDLALARGYARDDILEIAHAYDVAQRLLDGAYRPCGRPFINHLVGTASVLMHYGFDARVVTAGLLHAAYTHVDAEAGSAADALTEIDAALGGEGSALQRRVRAYADRDALFASDGAIDDPTTLSILEAEIVAIEAANEIEMLAAGEFRYSGRKDAMSDVKLARIAHVCRVLGVEGLHATLLARRERDGASSVPPALQTGVHESYRLATRDGDDVAGRASATLAAA